MKTCGFFFSFYSRSCLYKLHASELSGIIPLLVGLVLCKKTFRVLCCKMPQQSDDFEESANREQSALYTNDYRSQASNTVPDDGLSELPEDVGIQAIYPHETYVHRTGDVAVEQPQKTRLVKVGLRTFEVSEADIKRKQTELSHNANEDIVQENKALHRVDDNFVRKENLQQSARAGQTHIGYVADEVFIDRIAKPRERRRKRKRNNSISSLPVSTVSAFSAFAHPNNAAVQPKRSTCQLVLNSSIMFGREFCYAVEAGLTTPILLSIGLPSNMYSLVWAISPILGFILQPIIGNLSDRCTCRWGKRRPFILGLAVLLLIGITLFLNGEQIVGLFYTRPDGRRVADAGSIVVAAISVTIVGVVIFDFSADFIEGPIRAYAMDVCDEDDVKVSLLYQAIFTGAGGAFGYASGGISWTRDTPMRQLFPTDRQVVYTAAAFIFIICCIFNLLSISETSLNDSNAVTHIKRRKRKNKLLRVSDEGPHKAIGARTDQNQNYIEAGNGKYKGQPNDAEISLLNSLMTQNRNHLFEQYETSNYSRDTIPSTSSDPVIDRKLRKASDGGIMKSYRKHAGRPNSASKKSRERHSRKARSNTGKSQVPSSLTYGTFLPGRQQPFAGNYVSPYQPLSDLQQYSPAAYQPAINPYFAYANQTSHLNASMQQPWTPPSYNDVAHHDSVLAARATYPSALQMAPHVGHPRGSYSSDSGSDSDSLMTSVSSIDYMAGEVFPYAAVDPAFKNYHEESQMALDVYQHEERGGMDRLNAANRKKISPDIGDRYSVVSDVKSSASGGSKNSSQPQEHVGGLKSLVRSIMSMPKELRYLCVCHLFGWIAFVCMALFFTDFVGQVVMRGDPRAPPNSRLNELYRRGVEIGNWGLTINAASSCVYCIFLKSLIKRFGTRPMYVFGYFTFGIGSCIVALIPTTTVVLTLSSVIGILSATLYTLPYLLVAQYHEGYKHLKGTPEERGIGTDCALVTCMIQLAQIITGLGVGALVNLMDTVTVTVATSSIVAFIGTVWAAFCVKY